MIADILLQFADSNCNLGFPFSALIINTQTKMLVTGTNHVYTDPTAHAEIDAIRNYVATYGKLNSDCIIISSGEPCPMCLTAIAWAGIKKVYYIRDYQIANQKGYLFDQSAHETNRLLHLDLLIKKYEENDLIDMFITKEA
jgi:tRNA(Arg) A34 adenosine deaminase TadA